jgi:hypothetical protein
MVDIVDLSLVVKILHIGNSVYDSIGFLQIGERDITHNLLI